MSLLDTPEQVDDFFGLVVNARSGVVHDHQCPQAPGDRNGLDWQDNLARTKSFCQNCLGGRNPIRARSGPPRPAPGHAGAAVGGRAVRCGFCLASGREWTDPTAFEQHLVLRHSYSSKLARESAKRQFVKAGQPRQLRPVEYVKPKRSGLDSTVVEVRVREPREDEVL